MADPTNHNSPADHRNSSVSVSPLLAQADRPDIEDIQKYLNETYGANHPEFKVDVDGIPGIGTLRAITAGAQIELGYTGNDIDGVYGDAMAADIPDITPDTDEDANEKFIKLVQCGLRCKGYRASTADSSGFGKYNLITRSGVDALRSDANYTFYRKGSGGTEDGGTDVVDSQVWKGLCRQMDFVKLPAADDNIREIQRYLNLNYQPSTGLNPADGVVTPTTSRALIKAVQSQIGVNPDGFWGDEVASHLPSELTSSSSSAWRDLITFALYINGYGVDVTDPNWSENLGNAFEFAKFMLLAIDASPSDNITASTIAALFVSYGNQNRGKTTMPAESTPPPRYGIDLATKLNGISKTLVNPEAGLGKLGPEFVARYMQNAPQPVHDKELTPEEIEQVFSHRLTNGSYTTPIGIVPIWQTSANSLDYFTPEQGTKDARLAKDRGDELGIPNDITVYFAVDYDAYGDDIGTIVSYFTRLNTENEAIGGRPIGVYGPRLVCNEVSSSGGATASFVANLSYGWSSNIGQPMPTNWALDQYNTIKVQFYNDSDGSNAGDEKEIDQVLNSDRHGKMWMGEGSVD